MKCGGVLAGALAMARLASSFFHLLCIGWKSQAKLEEEGSNIVVILHYSFYISFRV